MMLYFLRRIPTRFSELGVCTCLILVTKPPLDWSLLYPSINLDNSLKKLSYNPVFLAYPLGYFMPKIEWDGCSKAKISEPFFAEERVSFQTFFFSCLHIKTDEDCSSDSLRRTHGKLVSHEREACSWRYMPKKHRWIKVNVFFSVMAGSLQNCSVRRRLKI